MPIVFVCDTKLSIVWIDGNFCEVIDCDHRPALGNSLHEFLQVPAGHGFREEVKRLGLDLSRSAYSTELLSSDQQMIPFDFFLEHVPNFEGIQGASMIAVGVESDGRDAREEAPVEAKALALAVATTDDDTDVADPLRKAYRYSNLRYEDGALLFARLEALVGDNKAYLNPDFTLEEAAARLSSNVLYVSQVTNYFAGVSFPNYLNQKRYDHLRTLILSDGVVEFAVQYHKAGFGSYSALNRFLRSRYDISPTELQRELKAKQR